MTKFGIFLPFPIAAALFMAAPAPAQPACADWTDPHAKLVELGPGSDLAGAVRDAASGTTLLLSPGTYFLASSLRFTRDDVTLRSKTGDRDAVMLDGAPAGSAGNPAAFLAEILVVSASRVTLADLSVRHARHHGVHAYPPSARPIAGLRMRNLRVQDCGEQLVKVNSNGGSPPLWADSGTVECCLIGFVDNSVMEKNGSGARFYTGWIDVHGGRGWIIRNNVFRNIQREGQSMEHAVHLWSKSRDCLVENNRFEDVYRAIGLGMKTAPDALERHYPDGKGDSPYHDFLGGMIRNNVIHNRAGIRLESGIEMMNVLDVEVYHNTVYSRDRPFSSIEYRWPDTRVTVMNNLVSQSVLRRDGAQGTLAGNLEEAVAGLFLDAAQGDLHLKAGAAQAIDKGAALAAGKAGPGKTGVDFDGAARDSLPDIGADEFGNIASVFRPWNGEPGVGGSAGARGIYGLFPRRWEAEHAGACRLLHGARAPDCGHAP